MPEELEFFHFIFPVKILENSLESKDVVSLCPVLPVCVMVISIIVIVSPDIVFKYLMHFYFV